MIGLEIPPTGVRAEILQYVQDDNRAGVILRREATENLRVGNAEIPSTRQAEILHCVQDDKAALRMTLSGGAVWRGLLVCENQVCLLSPGGEVGTGLGCPPPDVDAQFLRRLGDLG